MHPATGFARALKLVLDSPNTGSIPLAAVIVDFKRSKRLITNDLGSHAETKKKFTHFTGFVFLPRFISWETFGNMTTIPIKPLRKRKITGELYARLPQIEAKLMEIYALGRDEILVRCAMEDRESAQYLPSECLLYLVRDHRSGPFDAYLETVFKTLLQRVLRGLPHGESKDGSAERLTDCNVRDQARHWFIEMLAKDRLEYVEKLDFFEVRFEAALKKLRIDAQRKVYPVDNALEPIETDQDSGEIAEKVERAAGSFDPFDAIDDSEHRLRLDQAIDALPALQKAIMEMLRKGIPIESNEPQSVTISNTLRKTSKTIRTHRDKAFVALRAALTKGDTL